VNETSTLPDGRPSSYDELRDAYVNGDTSITPAQLEKARIADEMAALQAKRQRVAAEQQAQAEHDAAVEQLAADAAAAATGLAKLQDEYQASVLAIRALRQSITAWRAARAVLANRAKQLEARHLLAELPELADRADRYSYLAVMNDDALGNYRTSFTGASFHDLHSPRFRAEILEALGEEQRATQARIAAREQERKQAREAEQAARDAALAAARVTRAQQDEEQRALSARPPGRRPVHGITDDSSDSSIPASRPHTIPKR
jgi:hypothetical protein